MRRPGVLVKDAWEYSGEVFRVFRGYSGVFRGIQARYSGEVFRVFSGYLGRSFWGFQRGMSGGLSGAAPPLRVKTEHILRDSDRS